MKRKRKFAWENPAPAATTTRRPYDPVGFKRGLGHGIVVLSPDVFSHDPESRTIQTRTIISDRDRDGRLA